MKKAVKQLTAYVFLVTTCILFPFFFLFLVFL